LWQCILSLTKLLLIVWFTGIFCRKKLRDWNWDCWTGIYRKSILFPDYTQLEDCIRAGSAEHNKFPHIFRHYIIKRARHVDNDPDRQIRSSVNCEVCFTS